MQIRYLKRYRMEMEIWRVRLAQPTLPDGYCWQAWSRDGLDQHAQAKFLSFHGELDSRLFAALSTMQGCRDLMASICAHPGFLPQATWRIDFIGNSFRGPSACGTIQGIIQNPHIGSIQNVGILPEHRGFGLGRALLLKSLHGFQERGIRRVYLDVTANNVAAVELYRSAGFQCLRTSYREMAFPLEIAEQEEAT